ncbi:MAG: LEA type 2 family protein [Treponema sp.]|jgi:LEA14-like dessication related protein|nr:LEA type 2 family protein [Treponema sp.]
MKKSDSMICRTGRFAVLLFLAVFVLAGCKTMPGLVSEPVVSFDSVSFKKITFDGVEMLARINVENGNPFSIPLPALDWEFFVADEPILKGSVESGEQSGLKLPANGSTGVEIPFTVPFESVYSAVTQLADADEAPYKIQVGARFPIPVIGEKTFTTNFEGFLPLLKAPNLSFGGIKFNSVNPLKVEFVLTWSVENKNAFPIRLDSLGYEFAVNGSPWATGRAPDGLNLAARKTTQVPVTVSISALSLIRDIAALAGSGKSAAFACAGEASLRPVFEGLEAFSVPFNFTGNTDFRK